MSLRLVQIIVTAFVMLFLSVESTNANTRNQKKKKDPVWGQKIKPEQVFPIQIALKTGKKTKNYSGVCLQKTPGNVVRSKNVSYFRSFAKQSSVLRAKNSKDPKITLLQRLNKEGTKLCKKPPAPPPAPIPPNLSLNPYQGPFGEAEARLLYDRFGFGGRPDEIAQAVAMGLDQTIAMMTSAMAEPALDAMEADLRCDGRFASDPNNETCDANNPNDLSTTGVRYGLYLRAIATQRPFFEKLFMFLHDERLSASTAALSSCELYALIDHVDMIRKGATTGDYREYMREWNFDLMGHLEWLDGASNSKVGPNENYAREFWELGTVAPTDLNGMPVYSDMDIARSALAFTGWKVDGYQINNSYICLPSFVPGLHATGPHIIFDGTPWRAAVEDADSLLAATFNHPRTAESLAEDLWKEFINPNATPDTIRLVAQLIRDNNFNLIATLRVLMKSEALFSSRKTLIKHPIEKLIGFLRTTGIPVDIRYIDWWLEDLGQRPLLPPSVFGWDEKRLAGEAYLLEGRNVFLSILTASSDDWKEDYGYDFYQRFLASMPISTTPSLDLINRLSQWMNVPLNDAQKARLSEYLDFDLQTCWNVSLCGGQRFKQVRNAFDPYPTSTNWNSKLRGALLAIVNLPKYSLK